MTPRKYARPKFSTRTFALAKSPAASYRQPQTDESSFYHQLFNLTHVIKLIIDPVTLQIIEANPAACTFYGYSLEQFKRLTIPDINTLPEPDVRSIVQNIIAGTLTTFQTRHRLASGDVRDVEVQAGLLALGTKNYLYSVVHDITERKQIENELRNSEQIYRLFAQNIPDSSVLMFDTDMRYTLVEGPFLKRFGLVAKTLLGKRPPETDLSPETLTYLMPVYERALQGESFSFERVTPDYAYQGHVSPVRDTSGTIIGGMVLSHDITERKRLEAALRASEEHLRLITDSIQDVVTRIDRDDRILYVSASSRAVLGYSPEDIIGKSPQDFFHPDDWLRMDAAQRQSIEAANDNMRGEARMRHADGHYIDTESTGKFLYDDQGTFLGGIYVTRDITERKQLEAALRDGEKKFRLIAENTSDGLIQYDHASRSITYASPAYDRLFGREVGETIGGKPKTLQDFIHPDDKQRVVSDMTAAIQNKRENWICDYRSQHKDGHYFWREDHARFNYSADGHFLNAYVISRDITERKRLEASLRASEERLRLITDNIQDVITQSDPEGRIIYANSSTRAVLGFAPQEMVGKLARDFLHPDDWARLRDVQEMTLKSGRQNLRGEGRMRHAGGHYIHVETSVNLLHDEQDNFLGGIYVTRDITERKQLQEQLRASEERLRLITDNMQDLVILVNENEEIVYVSPSIGTVMGYDTSTIVGTIPAEAAHPDDRERVFTAIVTALASRQSFFTVESRLRHADGHYREFELLGRFLYDEQSNPAGSVFVARDITERKRLEASLRASEESLRLITDNMQDLILLTNPNREAVYYSPSFTRVLGHAVNTLCTIAPVNFIHPDDRPLLAASIQKLLSGQEPQITLELRVAQPDGNYISFEDVFRPIYDSNGKMNGILHVLRDITNRKQMEDLLIQKQKLQTALDKEQELSTLKTRMMQRINHEFRTPLTIIQASTETLTHYHQRLSEANREAKNAMVHTQIRRITDMLDEMALVLRSTTNADHFNRSSANLSNLCSEIAAELSTSLGLPDKYQLHLPPNLIAFIDPAVLRDGLTHIMRNAARFSEPADPVTVHLEKIGDTIELRVTDSGIGVPANELPRIFDPFFRGSNISERGGLGIGLTIARSAIEAHGGTIRAQSQLGSGTTFIITLPA